MGDLTEQKPKCMIELVNGETILSRQLRLLSQNGIKKVVMTTGAFEEMLVEYTKELCTDIELNFVYNEDYIKTNYIYSMFLAKQFVNDDILLLHGDLVFSDKVVSEIIKHKNSVYVDFELPLPQKDFKAVLHNNKVISIGIQFFENAVLSQPIYNLTKDFMQAWMEKIEEYCKTGRVSCYAEDALNDLLLPNLLELKPLEIKDILCTEIDTYDDWQAVNAMLKGDLS